MALERDNFEGTAARHKKAFVITIDRPGGVLPKREVLDLLNVADPARISEPANPGDVGIGDPFAMPYQTIEAVLPTRGDRLALVNDTNFGSRGRNPGADDPSDFIEVRVPGLRDAGDDDEDEDEQDGDEGHGKKDKDKKDKDRGKKGKEKGGGGHRSRATTLSIIGDTPYGDEQVRQFPLLVADVDRQPDVRGVVHLGDVKSGSSTCTDERFRSVLDLFNTFDDPFVLTPGDNDWTDCHRANNGAFLPTERLAKVREVFYTRPGRTLGGRPMKVETQASDPRFRRYVENQRFETGGTVIATVHVVGSKNGLLPWFGAAETAEQRNTRLAEVAERDAANLAWIDAAFDRARESRARGVVLAMQADTFAAGPGGLRAGARAHRESSGRLRRPGPPAPGRHAQVQDRPAAAERHPHRRGGRDGRRVVAPAHRRRSPGPVQLDPGSRARPELTHPPSRRRDGPGATLPSPAVVAQLVEHFTRNEGVSGSNPLDGFTESPC